MSFGTAARAQTNLITNGTFTSSGAASLTGWSQASQVANDTAAATDPNSVYPGITAGQGKATFAAQTSGATTTYGNATAPTSSSGTTDNNAVLDENTRADAVLYQSFTTGAQGLGTYYKFTYDLFTYDQGGFGAQIETNGSGTAVSGDNSQATNLDYTSGGKTYTFTSGGTTYTQYDNEMYANVDIVSSSAMASDAFTTASANIVDVLFADGEVDASETGERGIQETVTVDNLAPNTPYVLRFGAVENDAPFILGIGNVSGEVVPEPTALSLLAVGVCGLLLMQRRRRVRCSARTA